MRGCCFSATSEPQRSERQRSEPEHGWGKRALRDNDRRKARCPLIARGHPAARGSLCGGAVADGRIAVARPTACWKQLAVHARDHLRTDQRRIALGLTAQLDADAAA